MEDLTSISEVPAAISRDITKKTESNAQSRRQRSDDWVCAKANGKTCLSPINLVYSLLVTMLLLGHVPGLGHGERWRRLRRNGPDGAGTKSFEQAL